MYEPETRRQTHLSILLGSTVFILLLACESAVLGWEPSAVVLLLAGTAMCWFAHVTERVPARIRLWMYFAITMLGFFFFALHEAGICDMAPVMIFIIIVYSAAETALVINLCVAAYCFTLAYDFAFVLKGNAKLAGFSVTRITLHLVLVYMAGRLAKAALKRREEDRKEQENRIGKLEEINRKTEDFMANVSHELRTPINVVTGLTAVMLKSMKDGGERKNILSIQMAGYRLFNQIEDILDYTEIDTGRISVSQDTYTISSVIRDITGGKYMPERKHELELVFDIDAGIPAVLFGDGRKIRKIIQHLLGNAVKFTKKGGVYVRVYAVRKVYGINLCIKVCDTGIGIDGENLEKITGRFFQTNEGRNRSSGGLGLGLSIVSGMVSAMEGFMQIESVKDAGTAVSVCIPQKVSDESPFMALDKRAEMCIGCYLKLEKFEVPEVRDYYNEMILHLSRGLNTPLHRVSDMDELKALAEGYRLTHLITAKEEYEENAPFFESLAESVEITVVAEGGFAPPPGSRIIVFRKPFLAWPFIRKLNAKAAKGKDPFKRKRMVCPGVSVLVVDDEPMNLMVAEGLFKEYQMDVKTAQSGMEAIEMCGKEAFDLVFLDHMMPEMDGVETLKHLCQIRTETGNVDTVIAFTANASSSAREMLLREGFDQFVSKPVENLELERVLKEVLPKSAIKFLEDGEPAGNGNAEETLSQEDSAARLESLGIHTRSGMQYCRGSMELYQELLIKFARNEEQKTPEINEAFARGDIGTYRILVHALKSSSKMVGADALSKTAERAEDAAKNNRVDYIKAHHGELLAQYHALARGIVEVFGADEGETAQAVQGDGTELSKAAFIQYLTQLKGKLDTFEAESSEALLAKISGAAYRGVPAGKLLSEVRRDVDEFEFKAASEKVETLLRRIEGGEI